MVAQITVKNHEKKNEKQVMNKQTNIKSNRKLKEKRNKTPTVDHFPRNGKMVNTDLQSDISY